MTNCAICKRTIKVPKYTITIRDFTDDRGDWQDHPIHGTCLDRMWAWAKTTPERGKKS